ncbi:MAG: hemolysin family protein [Candidatus Krumholzibacteria bacterium]
MHGLVFYLIALVVLIAISAFFSGSEAALFSLSRSQLNRLHGHSGAGREVVRLLSKPRNLLITILIGNLVVNVFTTSAVTAVAVRFFGDRGVVYAFAFMSVLILVFGEIFPKVLAINRPVKFSLLQIFPLRFFHTIFYPAQIPIARFTDSVIAFLTARLGFARRYFSRDELLTALDIGRDDGHMGEFEYQLLSNIIEFRDTVVREIMTPSISVFSLPLKMNPDEMEEQILRHELSRVPVYGETADDVRGVLHIKDLAATPHDDAAFDISTILRPPYYVPETTRISELFKELARRRSQLAVVIDEYGSYVGIVTLEDILEELVGEIRDAKEPHTFEYTLLDDHRIVVTGTMAIDDFNDVFGTDIVDEEHETIAGYVTGATGNIPREGETVRVGELRFHIISVQPNRVRKMRVEKA